MAGIIIFIVLIVLVLWILASCIRIVPQAYAIVVERLGAYKETWNTGIHFKTPFIDRVARKSQSERAGCGFSTTAGYYQR